MKTYRRALVALSLCGASLSAMAETTCDTNSLSGNYSVNATGSFIPMIASESGATEILEYQSHSLSVTGTITADGQGGAQVALHYDSAGFPPGNVNAAGTYTVNSDCTGALDFTTGGGDTGEPAVTIRYAFTITEPGKFSFVSRAGELTLSGTGISQ